MIEFIPINLNNQQALNFYVHHLKQCFSLFVKYSNNLFDDFSISEHANSFEHFLYCIKETQPHFYIILFNDKFAGFVFLDNWKINPNTHKNWHSAEITACFDKKFWGDFTYRAGKKFIQKTFKKFNIKKLNAYVFSHNKIALGLLKKLGFKIEGNLKSESISGGKTVDIIALGLIKNQTFYKESNQK